MFILELYDRKGQKLALGDIVKVSNSRAFNFYVRLTYLPGEGIIAPFHTFSYSSVEKVDQLPCDAIKANDERYDVWHIPGEEDPEGEHFRDYLLSWRQCEHHLQMWKIRPYEQARTAGIF